MLKTTPVLRLASLIGIAGFLVAVLTGSAAPQGAQAAACRPPTAAYAQSTTTVSLPTAADYKIWSRIKAPNTTNNSYLVEVDGNTCFTVGDSTIPTGAWTWVDYQNASANSKITMQLTAGQHSIKILQREPGVQVDRLIFATDHGCLPSGTGDNCVPSPVQPNGQVIVPFRMNVGGSKHTDRYGAVWIQDTYFTGGKASDQGAGKAIAGSGGEDKLYQDERWGMNGYSIPIANGTYLLALHFAEIYPGCNNKVGCRVFSVTVEGNKILSDFDIVKAAGGSYKAYVQLATVTVSDGKLDLGFKTKVNASSLSALQILPAGTQAVQGVPAVNTAASLPPALVPTKLTASAALSHAGARWTY